MLKEKALERLIEAKKDRRLAHAYLLEGGAGVGKTWLAQQLSALVLGATPQSVVEHPDYHAVAPESKSRRIVIDQMRELEGILHLKPMLGATKVAVIHDADRLQPQAANSFLKTLEEPPPGCHLFLTTSLPDAVMETILSRCISVPLRASATPPPSEGAEAVAAALIAALLQPGGPDLAAAIRFARIFQKSTSAVRTRVAAALEAELKLEVKRYRDTTDAKWGTERDDQIKAQAEAAVIRERSELLQATAEVLAGALRCHHLSTEAKLDSYRRIAEVNPPHVLLRRLDALERTRGLLARGVQEGLALESGFLDMIALP